MSYQELLREKAAQVCAKCSAAGISQPFYRMTSEYSINFSWQHDGKNHTLTLYYKAKQQSWKPVANTEWLKQAILPVLQPLFGQLSKQTSQTLAEISSAPTQEQRLQAYFANALACLALLTPFANDNIDFSIICQRTRESIRMVLDDPACPSFNCKALLAALDTPDTSDYHQAKEYLTRCLTLCNINNAVN